MSRVFSYVVRFDGGFAPNPFHGWCTLACCKPRIRKVAKPGDLVVGLSPRCESIVYMVEVGEKLTFAQYWHDARFRAKRPRWRSTREIDRQGDNIYRPDGRGGFVQIPSVHWNHESNTPSRFHTRRDTGADAALVSRKFVYYGAKAIALPEELEFLRVTRGHRSRFTPEQVGRVRQFFSRQPRGVQGAPKLWRQGDVSWKTSCG